MAHGPHDFYYRFSTYVKYLRTPDKVKLLMTKHQEATND